jgi:ubiquinone/menaquinone biosynthesis C-methylase UbiE
MTTPSNPPKKERPSTYFVQDRQNERELVRLAIQGHMLTESVSGTFPEQPDPAIFRRVLDVGCGPGSWVIEAAQSYPTMSLIGIDISMRMIEYAREQAAIHHVADRVEFAVMDALLMLEFPAAFFDLVNLRFSASWMRTWDWPKMLGEMLRVVRPGGVIRITEPEMIHVCNSSARTQFDKIFQCAMYRAGHLFTEDTTGIVAHLTDLLTQHGCQEVQTKAFALEYQPETPQGQAYYDVSMHVFRTLRPFIQKWGGLVPDYDMLIQRTLDEMQQPDFHSTWNILTAWGRRP